MRPGSAWLPGGRLHLHHGPIDLVVGADGADQTVFAKARARFATLLEELVAELPALRRRGACVVGPVPRRMSKAVAPFADLCHVTPMAAVAGAVADEVLGAMIPAAPDRAYVNNGGDIAVFLAPGHSYSLGVATLTGEGAGTAHLRSGDGIGGIATSGFGGRSLSLGIAESVTVLAKTAAAADAAATLVANSVDLPGHPAIWRCKAEDLVDDSDLAGLDVVAKVGPLAPQDVSAALDRGMAEAERMRASGLIAGAALRLRGQSRVVGMPCLAEVA